MIVHTINGDIDEPIYDVKTYPYKDALFSETVRDLHGNTYYNIPCAFDIETTNIVCEKPYSYMYHWQVCIIDKVIFGRTWEEFIYFIDRLKDELQLTDNKKIVFYVHNLGFEFQHMRNFLRVESVFARKKRMPIKVSIYGGIEFRCSYILSNMSLDKFCQNSRNVVHSKNVGIFDYKKLRTPTTKMTVDELSYCYNDVRGLCECISDRLQDDTIVSIPLTSTGYVRREYRKAVLKNRKNKKKQLDSRIDEELYIELKEAFRGGNTHANAYYVNEVIENVQSYDIGSSYPARMMLSKFPTKFIKINASKLNEYVNQSEYAFLVRLKLENVRHKLPYGIPYIDIAHCRHIKNAINDNGRILQADSIEITVTDVDYRIIIDTYDIGGKYAKDLYIAKYEYLPAEFRKKLLEYYIEKCTLKGVDGKEYEYAKSKNRVNSSFGMMVTDIAQDDIIYKDGEWAVKEKSIQESLDAYYNKKNTFLSYQHGVWVTAHARKSLNDLLTAVGMDILYCDTDSGKIYGDHSEDVKKINENIMKEISSAPIPPIIHVGDKKYIMGLYEFEGIWDEFKTLGAKKYVYKQNGKYTITVAGLSKKKGSEEINKCGISEFKIGKIFTDSGRLTSYYNDASEPYYIEVNGESILTGSNVALVDTTYELGITDTYAELLGNIVNEK